MAKRKILSLRELREKGYRAIEGRCITVLVSWASGDVVYTPMEIASNLQDGFSWATSPIGPRIWQDSYDILTGRVLGGEQINRLRDSIINEFTIPDINYEEIFEEKYSEDLI